MSHIQKINQYLHDILKLHKELKHEFIEHIMSNNFLIIYTGAVLCTIMQFANMMRILLSPTLFQGVSNRYYFAFYLSLFTVALIPIILRNHWPEKTTHKYYCQLSFAIFYILWNLLFNSFTLNMQTSSAILVFTSALIFTSILFHFKPQHTISIQVCSYLIFLVLNYQYISLGNKINLTIALTTTIFCTLIIYVQHLHLIHVQKELKKTNLELQNQEDLLRMGLEKHQYIMTESNLFSFDWDLTENTISPSRNCCEILNWPTLITKPHEWVKEANNIYASDQDIFLNFMKDCLNRKQGNSIDIRIKDRSFHYTWYQLQLFIQYDLNDTPSTAIGVLLNIDGSTRLIENLNKQLHTQLEGSKQYLEQIKDSQEKTIIYRHDMRHSLKLMEQLAYQGDLEKLCSYLAETHNKLDSITPNFYCENETFNLILGSFDQLCKRENISFLTDVMLPVQLAMNDTEICSILFNLLENALAASTKVIDTSSRYIKVQAQYNQNKLLIFTENSFSGSITKKGEIPISPDPEQGHGFGIKSIISLVDKYNGLYTFETKNQVFYAKILLELDVM